MKRLSGDCLELLKEIANNSVDLVFCDLPYGQTHCKWDCKIDLNELWKEFERIRQDKHTPFFFTCTTRFGYELIKSNEKWFRYDLVWEKSVAVGFLSAKRMPLKNHEMIYVFYENLPLYDISNHSHKLKKVESTSVIHWQREDTIYGDFSDTDFKGRNGTPRYDPPLPKSVLQFKCERGKHKTQKPTTMMEWILRYYSKEGDIVLDPTMGSGSMGVACKSMNRYFIGIEMDEEIYKVACERLG